MSTKLDNILSKIPTSPGVYQFFNDKGVIIYIGKSVNLKSRVNSYFNGKSKLTFAKQKMVNQINDIKTILTNNETESLILETTLIKKHEPKYNILMKDGKNHVYIKITSEFIPRILKVRNKTGGGIYFGPYTSTNYVNNILKLVKKIFGYRSCNIKFTKSIPSTLHSEVLPLKKEEINEHNIILSNIGNIKIPCMDYYIGRCSAPCLKNKENIEVYLNNINKIKDFLKGDTNKIKEYLILEINKKAKNLKFEEAQKLKENLDSIKTLEENQIVRDGVTGDYNIINYIQKFEKTYIGMIEIRDSKITGFYNYDIKNNLEEDIKELLENFIKIGPLSNQITTNSKKTPIFILPFDITFKEESLKNIKIEVPIIGNKKELLDLCYKNIYEYAFKSHIDSLSTKGFTKTTMQNILNKLGYKKINKDILFECNDISHISGNHTVASRSIIENGKTNSSKYRKFKIKNLKEQEINDFDSMREVTLRRIKEIEKTGYYPDLIIIDGGKGQLSSVVEIFKEHNIENIQLVGLAKKEEELFLPGESESIILDKDSNELKLVQKIRDEAHRFAITFNRDSRIKSMKKNILESLPGFGPKTRSKILKKYGNIENLKNFKIEELSKDLNKNQIEALENHGII